MWFTIFTYEIIKYHRIANIKMEKKGRESQGFIHAL